VTISVNGTHDSEHGHPLDLTTIAFAESRRDDRPGYDEREVDAFVERCRADFDRLNQRVETLEAEAAEFRGRSQDEIVLESISILTTAQQTADTTVKNADEYSGRIMAEARDLFEESRIRANQIVDKAQHTAAETVHAATTTNAELQRHQIYLQAVRESMRIQLVATLESVRNHVLAEFEPAGLVEPSAPVEPAGPVEPDVPSPPHGSD
jgi:DivIVA domain-containing protein